MELNIKTEKYNPLIERKELEIEVESEITPKREEIWKKISSLYNTDFVVIKKIKQLSGMKKAIIYAHIYNDEKRMKEIEPKYIIERNFKKGGEGEQKA